MTPGGGGSGPLGGGHIRGGGYLRKICYCDVSNKNVFHLCNFSGALAACVHLLPIDLQTKNTKGTAGIHAKRCVSRKGMFRFINQTISKSKLCTEARSILRQL